MPILGSNLNPGYLDQYCVRKNPNKHWQWVGRSYENTKWCFYLHFNLLHYNLGQSMKRYNQNQHTYKMFIP